MTCVRVKMKYVMCIEGCGLHRMKNAFYNESCWLCNERWMHYTRLRHVTSQREDSECPFRDYTMFTCSCASLLTCMLARRCYLWSCSRSRITCKELYIITCSLCILHMESHRSYAVTNQLADVWVKAIIHSVLHECLVRLCKALCRLFFVA